MIVLRISDLDDDYEKLDAKLTEFIDLIEEDYDCDIDRGTSKEWAGNYTYYEYTYKITFDDENDEKEVFGCAESLFDKDNIECYTETEKQ